LRKCKPIDLVRVRFNGDLLLMWIWSIGFITERSSFVSWGIFWLLHRPCSMKICIILTVNSHIWVFYGQNLRYWPQKASSSIPVRIHYRYPLPTTSLNFYNAWNLWVKLLLWFVRVHVSAPDWLLLSNVSNGICHMTAFTSGICSSKLKKMKVYDCAVYFYFQ
jgi:hypothetical protein